MVVKSILLEQHTPLIHFQGDQDGANLRGTEFKSELDRFLVRSLGGGEATVTNYKKWLLPIKNSIAFDYKVGISAARTVNQPIVGNNLPFYFASVGNHNVDEQKGLIFSEYPIRLTISSSCAYKINGVSLIDFLVQQLAGFLLAKNFGNRQSKGYGSFYIHPRDPVYKDPQDVMDEIGSTNERFLRYSFALRVQGNDRRARSLDALRKLEVFYKAMRSGINVSYGRGPHHYLKSLLWLYFKIKLAGEGRTLLWEKKKIKNELLQGHPELTRQRNQHHNQAGYGNSPLGFTGTHELLIKDLFGLASHEEWKAKFDESFDKFVSGVARFKSPVLFKVLQIGQEYGIFFHGMELNEENSLINKEVSISKRGQSITMNTPPSFDFHHFFDFLCNPNAFDLDHHMLIAANNRTTGQNEHMRVSDIRAQGTQEYNNVSGYRILKTIFDQLQHR